MTSGRLQHSSWFVFNKPSPSVRLFSSQSPYNPGQNAGSASLVYSPQTQQINAQQQSRPVSVPPVFHLQLTYLRANTLLGFTITVVESWEFESVMEGFCAACRYLSVMSISYSMISEVYIKMGRNTLRPFVQNLLKQQA